MSTEITKGKLTEKIWKDIEGFEGIYKISNTGLVQNSIGTILKLSVTHAGYVKVNLSDRGVKKPKTIHRLVASAFIPNTLNKPCVNHLDGDKKNNHVENLEWCTTLENSQHFWNILKINEASISHLNYKKHGMHWKGKSRFSNPATKCIGQFDFNNILIDVFQGLTEAGLKVNTHYANISAACRGVTKSHKGYKWKYLSREEYFSFKKIA